LVIMISVFIGWVIVSFWAIIEEVWWVMPFVPYVFVAEEFMTSGPLRFILLQCPVLVWVVGIACYRYVKIRRYL